MLTFFWACCFCMFDFDRNLYYRVYLHLTASYSCISRVHECKVSHFRVHLNSLLTSGILQKSFISCSLQFCISDSHPRYLYRTQSTMYEWETFLGTSQQVIQKSDIFLWCFSFPSESVTAHTEIKEGGGGGIHVKPDKQINLYPRSTQLYLKRTSVFVLDAGIKKMYSVYIICRKR